MSKVFISYVHEDWEKVELIVRNFQRNGIGVWLDKKDLAGGQRWKKKIRDAIRSGLFFVSVHSRQRAEKEKTYASEELLIAIEELRLRPFDRTWLIPVRLDNYQIEDRPIGPGETYFDLHIEDLTDPTIGIPRLLGAVGIEDPVLDLSASGERQGREAFGGPLGTPHAAIKALEGIQREFGDEPADRTQIEKRFGENCIGDLVGLGLLETRRFKKIRLKQTYGDLTLALNVAVAAQPSFQVAVSVLNRDFNASGFQIGHEIGHFLGKNWTKGSKIRYGTSYRRWVVMFYPNFRKPEMGEPGHIWTKTIERESISHGRQSFLTDEVLADISRMKAQGLSVSEMARRLGFVPNVIHNWKRKYPKKWKDL
jgi:TIR domain/Transposase